jgi:RNA polymerase sigma-70 factor (ECF subfamily)
MRKTICEVEGSISLLPFKKEMRKEKDNLDSSYASALKRGEICAFDYFFNKYMGQVYRFTISYIKSEVDTDDLVQQVFIKLWKRRKNIDHKQEFRSYLFTITSNTIRDFFQQKARENRIQLEFYDFLMREKQETEEINFHTYLTILDEQIERLPPKRREIFIMHKKEGLTIDEIASVLQISPKTVENQYTGAVKTLREAFFKKNIKGLYLFFLAEIRRFCTSSPVFLK